MSPAERKRIAEALREGRCAPDLLSRAAALIDPPEPPGTKGTVRVRIAVAMRADGVWSAFGHSQEPEAATIDNAEGGVWVDGETDQQARLTWVEASVPLPEPPAVVEGSVT